MNIIKIIFFYVKHVSPIFAIDIAYILSSSQFLPKKLAFKSCQNWLENIHLVPWSKFVKPTEQSRTLQVPYEAYSYHKYFIN